jgi:heme oxygenase (mycobilin-producing)
MFVAINYITCQEQYTDRFEELFGTRAHAIDKMPGFMKMHVLRQADSDVDYLIVSYWESEDNFKDWTKSQEFLEGHKRGFEDLAAAKKAGKEPPMKSIFKTYKAIAH